MSAPWYVYIIECQNNSLYTGIAKDVAARYALHASGKGARYTRMHPPRRLLFSIAYPDRATALKVEYAIKQCTPDEKRAWIAECQEQERGCPSASRSKSYL